jgi:hypothetical protein
MPAETEMSTLGAAAQPAAETEKKQDGGEGTAPDEPNDDDDDDDITVIMLDQNTSNNNRNRPENAFAWIDSTSPEMEERRRNVLVQELRRVQRASFMHFALLCLIPTILLAIVVATVVGEEEDCESDASFCELEPRTFMNAFTTRVSLERKDLLVGGVRSPEPEWSVGLPHPVLYLTSCPHLPRSASAMLFQLIGRASVEEKRSRILCLSFILPIRRGRESLPLHSLHTQFHDSSYL